LFCLKPLFTMCHFCLCCSQFHLSSISSWYGGLFCYAMIQSKLKAIILVDGIKKSYLFWHHHFAVLTPHQDTSFNFWERREVLGGKRGKCMIDGHVDKNQTSKSPISKFQILLGKILRRFSFTDTSRNNGKGAVLLLNTWILH
jgi:hypothetical protein